MVVDGIVDGTAPAGGVVRAGVIARLLNSIPDADARRPDDEPDDGSDARFEFDFLSKSEPGTASVLSDVRLALFTNELCSCCCCAYTNRG